MEITNYLLLKRLNELVKRITVVEESIKLTIDSKINSAVLEINKQINNINKRIDVVEKTLISKITSNENKYALANKIESYNETIKFQLGDVIRSSNICTTK